MGFYVTDTVDTLPAKADPRSKNRVMGSRRSAATRARLPAPEPVDLHQETRDTSTKTVSGLVCWLSRDPIGERDGGLYVFARNNPACRVDLLGLLSKHNVENNEAFYSCNCGWIDLNHSEKQAGDARQILDWVDAAFTAGGSSEFTFNIQQAIKYEPFSGGLHFKYGLVNLPTTPMSTDDRIKLAMGVWLHAQGKFEKWQATSVIGAVFQSSYSVEDLPSDYLAMLLAAREKYGSSVGLSMQEVRDKCHALDKDDSLFAYEFGDGATINYSHIPELWKSKKGVEWCWPCQQVFDMKAGLVSPVIPDFFSKYTPGTSYFQMISAQDIDPMPGF